MPSKNITILFLGAGKRNSLLQYFDKAAAELDIDLKKFSYEINTQQPICLEAEILVGKEWSDKTVLDDVLSKSMLHKVDFLVANVDQASWLISEHKKIAPELFSFSSDEEVVSLLLNKMTFQKCCEIHQLGIIPSFDDKSFPIHVKPVHGAASQGTRVILSKAELQQFHTTFNQKNFVYQQYVNGDEYTVDCYKSPVDGAIYSSVRKRISVQGGEVTATCTVNFSELTDRIVEITKHINIVGPFNVQFMVDSASGAIFLMEINPRFGGGVVCSIAAGLNIPKLMLQDYLGIQKSTLEIQSGLLMKRYSKEVFFENSN